MSKVERPSHDDWRRQGQEDFLSSVRLIKRKYAPYRPGWDHDHCEFCGAKFSLKVDGIKSGYSTFDSYHWICEQCFNDFRDEFNWKVEELKSES